MGITRPRFDWTFNLGHVFMVLSLLGAGLGVYVGVFQTLTALVIRVDAIDKRTDSVVATREQTLSNKLSIEVLSEATKSIKSSNDKIVDTLIGIRVDLSKLQGQLQPITKLPSGP